MAEVLRAEAKTAGNSQRACKPRTYSAAPSWGPRRSPAKRVRWGEGGAKERNVVFGFSRKRNGADFAPTRGPGPQARRSLVTFHRWKVTRRRRDQKTNRREYRERSKQEPSNYPFFHLSSIGKKRYICAFACSSVIPALACAIIGAQKSIISSMVISPVNAPF